MEPNRITDEIKRLSLPQRLIIAQDIWDSIALESDKLTMPEWQKSELEKRYDQYKQGKLRLHDWREVHAELRERYNEASLYQQSLERFGYCLRMV